MREAIKIISIILSLIMVLSLFTAVPFTAGAVTTDMVSTSARSGDYEYNVLDDGTAKITRYKGSAQTLTIPSEIDGYTVTSIGREAFWGCKELTSVTIPDSVTSIGSNAFSDTGYYNIESNWENGVLYIDNFLIEAYSEFVSGEYKVKDGTKVISDRAFEECTSLTSVTIPDSVTSIDEDAFYSCTSLTSITIPNSVTSLGKCAFYDCTSLTSINVEGENDNYCSVDGVLFNKNKTELLQYPIGKTESTYEIPDSVTSIGEWSFSGCESLTSVTIPDSVTSIGEYAFFGCTSLTSVTIPESVTSIGSYAFQDCTSLTSITIPNSVTSIDLGAFENCTSLTSITIPDSVTSMGKSAFFNTGYYNDSSNWENDVLYIDNFLIQANYKTISGEYKVKDGTKVIADVAFADCTKLTGVTIPDSITTIDEYIFSGCTGLTSITIPDSVTSIDECAFRGCTSLKNITIPDSVTSIGEYALGYYFDWYIQMPDNVKIDNFKITGYTGTEAERYAKDNGFEFVSLGEAPNTAVFGDVDGDGVVSVMDATEIQRYKAEIITDDMIDLTVADVDKDDKVTVLDATRIQRYKAQLCNLDGSTPYIEDK